MNEPLIDMTQINNLKELFNDGFEPFLVTFYEDYEKKEQELATAIKGKQIDDVAKIAHSLKGSSLNMGALGLAKLCQKIETASKNDEETEVNQAFEELKAMYPVVKAEFNRISSIH
ncbi:MAG: Hpt domain-containing protein [Candidatus Berkiella sp.]